MNFEKLLSAIDVNPLQVIDSSIALQEYVPIDLSITNKDLKDINISSAKICEDYINRYLKTRNAKVAYGGYLEERNLYKGDQNFIGTEERTIHLGIDLWCEVGTKVLSILDGEVHSFQNNNNSGDYGPTIILRHLFEGIEFYSLYGHLSLASLDTLQVGQNIKQGKTIATLGTEKVNGGYASHLHFQLIKDIQGMIGDYPGVCSKDDLEFYKMNCPNPNLLLKLR